MNIKDIIVDSAQYPLSDLKKFFILVIILLITQLWVLASSFDAAQLLIWILMLTGFIAGFLVNGYFFRIIEYALEDRVVLPDFTDWSTMFLDGLKVFLVEVLYLLPAILVAIFLLISSAGYLAAEGFELNALLLSLAQSKILELILNVIIILTQTHLPPEYLYGLVYLLVISPLFFLALGLMANYDGELRAAFRFREIFNDIAGIGWIKLITWYLVTGLVVLLTIVVLIVLLSYILSVVGLDIFYTVADVLYYVILAYFYLFLARSLALIYISGQKSL